MTKKPMKVIKDVSDKLAYALDNIKWGQMYTAYLNENRDEEKRHDRRRPASVPRGLSIMDAARLFAVQQIVNYYTGEKAPDLAGYTHMRHSVFSAYSLVAQYHDEIGVALAGVDLDAIKALDYAELQKAVRYA